jgi:hypothetical protein
MRLFMEGVGLAGPGLAGWQASRPMLSGAARYAPAATVVPAAEGLPAAERRRVGVPVRLALAVGHEAFAAAGRDAAQAATVLASSGGDCDNIHHLCEALAGADREISPTRFHNSVHNAAAGYWGIATRSRAPSTSVSCHDASFAAGLLETAAQCAADGAVVALIAYDHPYPQPLAALRPIADSFGIALVVAPQRTGRAVAALDVDYIAQPAAATRMADAALERVRTGVPAARSLPLLALLARGAAGTVVLDHAGGHLRVAVAPCS